MADTDKAHSKRTRRRHKNSHYGCGLCRERKIKCDETLPCCNNCASKKARCPYLDLPAEQLEKVRANQSRRQLEQQQDSTSPFSAKSTSSALTSPDSPHTKSGKGALNEYTKEENIVIPCARVEFEVAEDLINTHFYYTQSMSSSELFEQGIKDSFESPHNNFFELTLLLSVASTMNYNCCISFAENYMMNVTKKPYVQTCAKILGFSDEYTSELRRLFEVLKLNRLSKVYKATVNYVANFKIVKDLQIFMLVASTLHLMWSCLYGSEDLAHYNKFMNGMTAFLSEDIIQEEKATVNPFLVMAEVMIQDFKKLYFPVYPVDSLEELSSKFVSFRQNNTHRLSHSQLQLLSDLEEMLKLAFEIVPGKKQTGLMRVSSLEAFTLLKGMIACLPPSIFNFGHDGVLSDLEVTIYTFVLAIADSLRSLVPEVSFLFCSDFTGPENSPATVRNTSRVGERVAVMQDPALKSYAVYCARVSSFFNKRYRMLDRLFLVREPFTQEEVQQAFQGQGNSAIDGIISTPRRLGHTTEVPVRSFDTQTISISNYPKVVQSEIATDQVTMVSFEDTPSSLDIGHLDIGSSHGSIDTDLFDKQTCLLKTDFDSDRLIFPQPVNFATLLNNKVVIHATFYNLGMIEMIRQRLLAKD